MATSTGTYVDGDLNRLQCQRHCQRVVGDIQHKLCYRDAQKREDAQELQNAIRKDGESSNGFDPAPG